MNQARVMVVWTDLRGAQVGRVTQGVAQTSAGLRAAYFAETVAGGKGFPRFNCAVREVERMLRAARIRAVRSM